MRSLRDLLVTGYGLDLAGWTLTEARDVSADGTIIVGWGTNPSGDTEGWVAEIEPIPEPFSVATLAMAVCGLKIYYRRKRRTA
jgi:hypothetical protein